MCVCVWRGGVLIAGVTLDTPLMSCDLYTVGGRGTFAKQELLSVFREISDALLLGRSFYEFVTVA